ncbi:hypothetical protein [Thermoplasma sp.]
MPFHFSYDCDTWICHREREKLSSLLE